MTDILEMQEFRDRVSLWTVKNYERAGKALAGRSKMLENTELIRGVIFTKMPKLPKQIDLCRWIYGHLLNQLPDGWAVFQSTPINLADSQPQPDIMVVRGNREDFRDNHPVKADLVIEITAACVGLKRELAAMHAEAEVPEHWIVRADKREVEIRSEPVAGLYRKIHAHQLEEVIICKALPRVTVSVSDWLA